MQISAHWLAIIGTLALASGAAHAQSSCPGAAESKDKALYALADSHNCSEAEVEKEVTQLAFGKVKAFLEQHSKAFTTELRAGQKLHDSYTERAEKNLCDQAALDLAGKAQEHLVKSICEQRRVRRVKELVDELRKI